MDSLKGKCILVTGASSGMGRVFCRMIAKEGARVILVARNEQRLKESLSMLKGESHTYYKCDLTSVSQVQELIAVLPPLDGIVLCAGVNKYIPLKFIKQETIDEIFSINYFSEILLVQGLLKKKLIKKNASLVFISSISSVLGVPGTLLYASSKGAVNSAVKVIAAELAPQGIRANAICPGVVRTEMLDNSNLDIETFNKQEAEYPLGYGLPEDVGYAVLYHLSDRSRWLTGNIMILDGGYSLK